MEIKRDFQSLVGDIALQKYRYIEIQGHEGREPENRLYIRAYESMHAQEHIETYHLPEKNRQSVKEVAARHSIEFEELPDLETKSKIQKEFDEWLDSIKQKEMDQISHYERAIEFARELSHGVVSGYWRNEIAKFHDILDMMRNARLPHGEFNVGRERLTTYLIDRIGFGRGVGQSYTTKRGITHYSGNSEVGDVDSMISTMVGIGMLKKVDGSNIYELTAEAFALLKEPKWHERHAEFLSWVSIAAAILSMILMLRELGIV